MQPGGLSSLIFVVIIGVWAAYFLQYWVRRREHLATARSVDQFSESMRILERRNPQPVTGAGTAASEAPATSAHAAYGQLLVRRAASAQLSAAADNRAASEPAREGGPSRRDEPARPAATSARRSRGLVLLGALSTAVVAVPLVALSMLPLWALLVPVVSIGGSFAWLRAAARSEQRARRSTSQSQRRHGDESVLRSADEPVRRTAQSSQRREAPVVAEAPRSSGPADDVAAVAADAAEHGAPVEQAHPAPRRGELYDVQAVEAAQATTARAMAVAAVPAEELVVPARPLVDEDDIPLTWDPVPVPRPTYTMKARVTRPAPTSADLVGDADTEYAPAEAELPVRRAAGA